MPNHVTNRLKINGTNQQIKEVFEKYNTHHEAALFTAYDGSVICKNKEGGSVGWLDLKTGMFRTRINVSKNKDKEELKRVGLPENWVPEITPARNCFPDFNKIIPHPECDEYYDKPSQREVENHPNNWYNWNRNNWGTKWNSYSHDEEDYGTYTFQTAWNGVPHLMLEMSKQNPEIEFEYSYADEDSGYNVGKFTFKNGDVLSAYQPNGGTKEAYDIYFELNPEYKKDYKLVGGTYKYIEEEITD